MRLRPPRIPRAEEEGFHGLSDELATRLAGVDAVTDALVDDD
jgi:hypothetical protein